MVKTTPLPAGEAVSRIAADRSARVIFLFVGELPTSVTTGITSVESKEVVAVSDVIFVSLKGTPFKTFLKRPVIFMESHRERASFDPR